MEQKMEFGLDHNPDARGIREEVFMKEQGFCNEFDSLDAKAWHVVIYEGGDPVATGRTFPKEGDSKIWMIGRVAVRRPYRGKNYGKAVIVALEKKLRELGASYAELSSQVQARGFYEKLGYTAYGEEYLDEHCPHIAMRKAVSHAETGM